MMIEEKGETHMKKFFAMMMVLSVIWTMGALAENGVIDQKDGSANLTVSYNVQPDRTFVVTIPASLEMQEMDEALSASLNVSLDASKYNVEDETLILMLTNAAFKLVYNESEIAYSVFGGEVPLGLNDAILSWSFGEARSQQKTLTFTADVPTDVLPSGEYADTLTFSVSIVNNADTELSGAGA